MKKLRERISPIQRQRASTKIKTSLARRGNIDRGQGIAPTTKRAAELGVRRKAARQGPTARAVAQERQFGQQISSTTTGMNAYNKLFEMLLKEHDQPIDRPARMGRQAGLNIKKGSGIGRAVLSLLRKTIGKTPLKSTKGLKVT